MDYKAAGAPKMGKNAPRHDETQGHTARRKPAKARPTKKELLARMKAAQQAKTDS